MVDNLNQVTNFLSKLLHLFDPYILRYKPTHDKKNIHKKNLCFLKNLIPINCDWNRNLVKIWGKKMKWKGKQVLSVFLLIVTLAII